MVVCFERRRVVELGRLRGISIDEREEPRRGSQARVMVEDDRETEDSSAEIVVPKE